MCTLPLGFCPFFPTDLSPRGGRRAPGERIDGSFFQRKSGSRPCQVCCKFYETSFSHVNHAHDYPGFLKSPPTTPMYRIPTQSTPRSPKSSKTTAKSTIWSHPPASPRTSTQSLILSIESRNSGASTSTGPTCSQPASPVT